MLGDVAGAGGIRRTDSVNVAVRCDSGGSICCYDTSPKLTVSCNTHKCVSILLRLTPFQMSSERTGQIIRKVRNSNASTITEGKRGYHDVVLPIERGSDEKEPPSSSRGDCLLSRHTNELLYRFYTNKVLLYTRYQFDHQVKV